MPARVDGRGARRRGKVGFQGRALFRPHPGIRRPAHMQAGDGEGGRLLQGRQQLGIPGRETTHQDAAARWGLRSGSKQGRHRRAVGEA